MIILSRTVLKTIDGAHTVETYDQAKQLVEQNPQDANFRTWIQVTVFYEAE